MIRINNKKLAKIYVSSFFQKSIGTLFLLLFLAACSNEDSQPQEDVIQGNVIFSNGISAENVSILIGGQVVGETDSLGLFSIQVEFGTHEISFFSGDASNLFSSISKTIIVGSNSPEVELNNLVLPVPVSIQLTSQNTHNIHLEWGKSETSDFREYRLYMNHSEAFDEDDNQLLLTTTEKNDTTYSINDEVVNGIPGLVPNQTYYFRVVVMDEFRQIGGSNVLAVTHFDVFDDPIHKLEILLSFNPPTTATGIAYDGTHLWISTVKPIGDFNDPDDIKLIKYDYKSGTKLKEFSYSNHIETQGISIDSDGQIWMVSDNLKGIDPNTGTITKEFAIPPFTRDITFDGEYMAVVDEWGLVKRIKPLNGFNGSSFRLLEGSGWRGIAKRENGDFWALNWPKKKIFVFDAYGVPKGSVQTNLLDDCGSCFSAGLYLSFLDSNTLALVKWRGVILLQVSDL